MDYVLMALAAVIGYLSGSVSYARVVTRLVAREEVKPIELITPDGGAKIVSPTISATAVRLQLGAKWGLTVALPRHPQGLRAHAYLLPPLP